MTTTLVRLHIEILLEAGLHIGTGFGVARMLDERTTCGPHPRRPTFHPETALPYIPGSSLKGRLRAKADEVQRALDLTDGKTLIGDLFGGVREHGRLIFSDAHLIREDETILAQDNGALVPYLALEQRSHVALSLTRRSALEDMLMRIEVVSPGIRMETTIRGWLPTERARTGLALLTLAVCTTTHLGGHKGRGLGAVRMIPTHVMIDETEVSREELGEALAL